MVAEHGDAFVQLAPQRADAFGIFGQRLLRPAVGDGAQQRDQRGRRGEDDTRIDAGFDQRRVGFERGGIEHFAGQEQHDKIRRRLELFPIGLAAELDQMVAHLPRMVGEFLFLFMLVGGFERFEISGKRRLGIDNDVLAAGQLDNHVGAQAAFFGAGAFLLEKVTMVEHAGHFNHAFELQLAPAAAGLWCAQGFDQIAGLGAQRKLRLGHLAHLFGQRGVGIDTLFFDVADLLLEFFQRRLDRHHHFSNGLLALVQIGFCAGQRGGLLRFQRGAGEFEEGLVVPGQRVGRNHLEGVGKAVARGFQRRLALGEQRALGIQRGFQLGTPYRQRRLFVAQHGKRRFACGELRLHVAQSRIEDERQQPAAQHEPDDQGYRHFH